MTENRRVEAFAVERLRFDPVMRLIVVNGQKSVLDASSTRIFAALAAQFGDCVSKDALLTAGWPGQHIHENSLAKSVSKLRRAIAGSGAEIAAVYGLGYVLRRPGDNPSAAAGQAVVEQPARAARLNLSGAVPWALTAAVLLITVVVSAVSFGVGQPAVAIRHTAPITNDSPNAIATILWVDDHPSNNRLEIEAFRRQRIAVHLAESTGDALKLLAINRYRLVISDLGRGEDRLAGVKMMDVMKQHGLNAPVIIYTVRPKDGSGQKAQRRLVAAAGAAGLAVTPEEVRTQVFRQLST
jgi:DNA-binding response OmpR family regulator